eukprot:9466137-Alexandrium_andersonii.AAC.1
MTWASSSSQGKSSRSSYGSRRTGVSIVSVPRMARRTTPCPGANTYCWRAVLGTIRPESEA